MENFITKITVEKIPNDVEDSISKSYDVDKVSKRLAYGQVEVIFSNDAVDRQGESIKLSGIDLTQIKRNPTLLWAHNYERPPIGRILDIGRRAGNGVAKLEFDYDIDEFSHTIYKKILRGSLNAVSIGGRVTQASKDGSTIEKLEMFELSVVPVGAHRDALVTAKSADYDDLKQRVITLEKNLQEPKEVKQVINLTI